MARSEGVGGRQLLLELLHLARPVRAGGRIPGRVLQAALQPVAEVLDDIDLGAMDGRIGLDDGLGGVRALQPERSMGPLRLVELDARGDRAELERLHSRRADAAVVEVAVLAGAVRLLRPVHGGAEVGGTAADRDVGLVAGRAQPVGRTALLEEPGRAQRRIAELVVPEHRERAGGVLGGDDRLTPGPRDGRGAEDRRILSQCRPRRRKRKFLGCSVDRRPPSPSPSRTSVRR